MEGEDILAAARHDRIGHHPRRPVPAQQPRVERPDDGRDDHQEVAGCEPQRGEATGIAATTTVQAAEYAKVRIQFGRPIATYQAVKHHCANMAVAAELVGLTPSELYELNPAFHRFATPPNGPHWSPGGMN
jgi:hypothetical protein